MRVDACGEIDARMADAAEIRGEPFRTIATDDIRHSSSEGQDGQALSVGRNFAEGMFCVQREAWDNHWHDRGSDLGWNMGKEYGGLER